jgi:hypothetical protein
MALVGVAVVIFTATNMVAVTVEIDPFGLGLDALRPLQLPLAFVILISLALGLVVGVVMMRLTAWPIYRDARRSQRELTVLRKENAKLMETLKAADHPASIALPATKR